MIYSEEFLARIKDAPLEAVLEAIDIAQSQLSDEGEWYGDDRAILEEAYALISEIIDLGILELVPPAFRLTGDIQNDCLHINTYLRETKTYCVAEQSKLKVQSLRSHFRNSIGNTFFYEFSQGDLQQIQSLISTIRELIAATPDLEEDHRRRLLLRLERLQSELHKKVSDLDRFWGLIGDASVVLAKLGKNAKPIVDRIKEIADIVWRTQSRTEELPSDTKPPLLSLSEEAES